MTVSNPGTPAKTSNPWARKIVEASTAGGGGWIESHGRYLCALKEVVDKRELFDDQNRRIQEKGFKGNSVTFRFQVLDSAKRTAADVDDPHPVGDVRSVVCNFDDKSNMAASKMRAILLALYEESEDRFKGEKGVALVDEYLKQLCSPGQPLMGKLIRGDTYSFTTKAGKPGVGVNWASVPQSLEPTEGQKHPSIAEMRTQLLGG
jgi:hypothetical protein